MSRASPFKRGRRLFVAKKISGTALMSQHSSVNQGTAFCERTGPTWGFEDGRRWKGLAMSLALRAALRHRSRSVPPTQQRCWPPEPGTPRRARRAEPAGSRGVGCSPACPGFLSPVQGAGRGGFHTADVQQEETPTASALRCFPGAVGARGRQVNVESHQEIQSSSLSQEVSG